MLYHLSSYFGMAPFSGQHRRDLTVALVGFTSWAAVAWKLGRPGEAEADASNTEGLLAWVRLAAAAALSSPQLHKLGVSHPGREGTCHC